MRLVRRLEAHNDANARPYRARSVRKCWACDVVCRSDERGATKSLSSRKLTCDFTLWLKALQDRAIERHPSAQALAQRALRIQLRNAPRSGPRGPDNRTKGTEWKAGAVDHDRRRFISALSENTDRACPFDAARRR